MKRYVLWFLAVLITLGAAIYQRLTGPTYPFRAEATLDGQSVTRRASRGAPRTSRTARSCSGASRRVSTDISNTCATKPRTPGRRSRSSGSRGGLAASLPKQPAAGKLAYRVVLTKDGREAVLSGENPVVIRFKGAVPDWVLIPHIIVMFLAMLLSTAAGLAAFGKRAGEWKKLQAPPGTPPLPDRRRRADRRHSRSSGCPSS